jgi:hypothetical protein
VTPGAVAAGHRIFQQFAPYDGWAEPGFERGYFGVNIRDSIFTGTSKGYADRRAVHVDHPPIDEEYFEWIALLMTIAGARDRVCIAEIGAGWGRWITSAAMLCRQKAIEFSLIGVEAEPSRFEMMQMVLRDNGIEPEHHDLLRAAAAARDGEVLLAGNEQLLDVYGYMIIRPDEVFEVIVVEWRARPGGPPVSAPMRLPDPCFCTFRESRRGYSRCRSITWSAGQDPIRLRKPENCCSGASRNAASRCSKQAPSTCGPRTCGGSGARSSSMALTGVWPRSC